MLSTRRALSGPHRFGTDKIDAAKTDDNNERITTAISLHALAKQLPVVERRRRQRQQEAKPTLALLFE